MNRFVALIALPLIVIAATAHSQVCDMVELDTIAAPGSLSETIILGTTAYSAGGTGGIVRVDISDPGEMEVVDFTSTPGQAEAMILEYFNNLLLVADGSHGVASYRIANDGSVSLVGNTVLGETAVSIAGIGGRFFVGTESGTLFALALDSNDEPTVLDSLALGGQVRGIVEKSGRVYCALGTAREIVIVDATEPSDLKLLGTVSLSGSVVSMARLGSVLLSGVEGVGLMSFAISGDSLVEGESLSLSAAPTDIFAWDGRIYMAAPDFGVTLADASLGQGFLKMSELQMAGAAGVAVSGDMLFVGRQEQGFSSLDASACADSGGAQTTWFIPAAARAVGAENTFWVSDVAVANFTLGVATFNVAYLVKDADNSNPTNVTMAIGAGQQVILADVFSSLFGLEAGNGALRIITSDVDVKITSRTYNAAGTEGTYGQFIPALTGADALEPGVAGVLIQLQQNSDFRTNVGLVNLTDAVVETEIHLYDGDGDSLGIVNPTRSRLVPFEMIQIGRIFDLVQAGRVDSGYAVVRVTSDDGKALVYASVIDQNSGDPIYLPTHKLVTAFAR